MESIVENVGKELLITIDTPGCMERFSMKNGEKLRGTGENAGNEGSGSEDGVGKLIMITGGARSGKSSFAEEMARGFGDDVLYIATAKAFDDEMRERIRHHRMRRPASWETMEVFRGFAGMPPDKFAGYDAVLLDCLTNLASNIMMEKALDWEALSAREISEVEAEVAVEVGSLVSIARSTAAPFVIVTNEIGMGVVPPSATGRAGRDIIGRANQSVAREAQEVYLCVSGIPVRIK